MKIGIYIGKVNFFPPFSFLYRNIIMKLTRHNHY